jgi:hypothetical protein
MHCEQAASLVAIQTARRGRLTVTTPGVLITAAAHKRAGTKRNPQKAGAGESARTRAQSLRHCFDFAKSKS